MKKEIALYIFKVWYIPLFASVILCGFTSEYARGILPLDTELFPNIFFHVGMSLVSFLLASALGIFMFWVLFMVMLDIKMPKWSKKLILIIAGWFLFGVSYSFTSGFALEIPIIADTLYNFSIIFLLLIFFAIAVMLQSFPYSNREEVLKDIDHLVE